MNAIKTAQPPQNPDGFTVSFFHKKPQNASFIVILHKSNVQGYHSFHNFTVTTRIFFDKFQIYGIIVFEAVAHLAARHTGENQKFEYGY